MEVHNFNNGVKFSNIQGISYKEIFYYKNIGRLALSQANQFIVRDGTLYSTDFVFIRTEISAIFDKGLAVPVPATDVDLYTLLCTYFYAPLLSTVSPTKILSSITGANYTALESNNGYVFLFNTPSAVKTFTIPSGLSEGWNCEVIKQYAGNTITIVGTGGMVIFGIDTILNNQYAKAQILVTSPTSAIVSNIGL